MIVMIVIVRIVIVRMHRSRGVVDEVNVCHTSTVAITASSPRPPRQDEFEETMEAMEVSLGYNETQRCVSEYQDRL